MPTNITPALEAAIAEVAAGLGALADRERELVAQADHLRAQLEQVGRDRLYMRGRADALRALVGAAQEAPAPVAESPNGPTEPAPAPSDPTPATETAISVARPRARNNNKK